MEKLLDAPKLLNSNTVNLLLVQVYARYDVGRARVHGSPSKYSYETHAVPFSSSQ